MNVAQRLTAMASRMPDVPAVVEPLGYDRHGRRQYRQLSFRQLDEDSDRISRGLQQMGVTPGTRLALLVRPGIDFVSLVFGLFKCGAVPVLIDPGMGLRRLIASLGEVRPRGFVAIPLVQAVRIALRRRFGDALLNVTVGRRWFWGGPTLEQLRATAQPGNATVPRAPEDPAAIIFTSGGTGPPKGVLYCHGTFDAQVEQLQQHYDIRPGEVDLPCFPLFGLFNCALGATAVIPDMNPSRPAQVNPANIVEAVKDWSVTQTFGSPAVWDRVSRYCLQRGVRLESVRRVFSAGAPVPIEVLERMLKCIHPDGEVFTPYGATEALPVSSIGAREVLGHTAAKTRNGAGVCVGGPFPGIRWMVVQIVDGPIADIQQVRPLPPGHIGELIVSGPVVTREYVTRTEANRLAKIPDGDRLWHRMGDAGYLDDQGRFWMCGRVVHRVLSGNGPMFSTPVEEIFNQHPAVRRSALVGVGPPGKQRPVVVIEPNSGCWPATGEKRQELICQLRQLAASHTVTAAVEDFLFHRALPVDVRHNVKIDREKLARWAAGKLRL